MIHHHVAVSGSEPVAPDSDADWHVVYTQSKSEQLAADNLQRQAFDVYLPLYKTYKTSKACRTPKTAKAIDACVSCSQNVPMFARYVFFRPGQAGQSVSTARSTRGVAFVLSFGFQIAVVKAAQLQAIQVFEQARNSADDSLVSPFQPGTRVRMADISLRGLEGLVTSVSSQRVKVLLELLGKQHTVSVEHHRVELA